MRRCRHAARRLRDASCYGTHVAIDSPESPRIVTAPLPPEPALTKLIPIAFVLWCLALAMPASAQQPDFETWKTELRSEALDKGISAATFDSAFDGVAPIPRIIELDRKQPERTITFDHYRDRIAVTDTRVARGRRMLAENRELLERIGGQFGVQPRFIVALWGLETNYGTITGGFPVISALATLAYDTRRPDFFRRELLLALQIIEEGHIAPAEMKGSWAGAMGQAQFMPSSFMRYAHDHDGDGHKDIWGTRADVFASAANYLSTVGWRDDLTWGRKVTLPAGFDMSMASASARGPFTKKTLPEWQALGVCRADGSELPTRAVEGAIVLPDGEGGEAYMIYANYYALLDWNRSLFFATSIGLLSDRIAGR
jgi:membrane-bound lytic murein transglycosylase B